MASDRAQFLMDEIRRHNRLYWDTHKPEISDQAYDALVEELRALQPDTPVLQELGGAVPGTKVKHRTPMLSLEKVYEDPDLTRWAEKVQGDFIVMPKVDGLAVSLLYRDGKLVRAATRGDGEFGEDVTANARTFVPTAIVGQEDLKDLLTGDIEVRGEVYLAKERFAAHYAKDFANPRNLAAGALKQKDPEKCRAYGLSFVAYDVDGFTIEEGKLHALEYEGFSVVPSVVSRMEHLADTVKAMAEDRETWPFEADGVVVRANRVSERARLGATSHHPRWAVAFKFQSQSAETTLKGMEWQVSRNGTITPVAVVEAVQLAGVSVTRASLHNVGYAKKLGVFAGARILMSRRGDVIPHVEEVLVKPDPQRPDEPMVEFSLRSGLPYPSKCPSCGSSVLRDGDFLRCATPLNCNAAKAGELVHFCKGLSIDGMGPALAEKLVQSGVLKTPADLYRVSIASMVGRAGVGKGTAANLSKQIAAKRKVRLKDLLVALGVDSLGTVAAEQLADRFTSLHAVRMAGEDALRDAGLGEVSARNVRAGMVARDAMLVDLASLVDLEAPVKVVGGSLDGKAFVFTGELGGVGREEAQRRVMALGGKCPSGVSKKVDFLVAAEGESGTTKYKAAQKLQADGHHIRVVGETEFLLMVAKAPKRGEVPVEATPGGEKFLLNGELG